MKNASDSPQYHRSAPHLTQPQFNKLSTQEQLTHLCALAHLAPSSHNTQPWRFKISPEKLQIKTFLDIASVLPASDPTSKQAIISIGCALQTLEIAASHFGYTAYTVVDKDTKKTKSLQPIAVTKLVRARPANNPLYESIFTRKVVRAEFQPNKPLPKNTLTQLKKLSSAECTVIVFDEPSAKQRIAELQGQADGYVINTESFSKELGSWLLPNDTKAYVGMPGVTFGLDNMQAKRIHKALKGEAVLEPEDSLRFLLAGKINIEKSAAVIALSIPKDSIKHWVAAGKTIQSILLTLESAGLQASIHAGIAEVALIQQVFKSTWGLKHELASILRAGYVKDKAHLKRPFAPRLPVEAVLL